MLGKPLEQVMQAQLNPKKKYFERFMDKVAVNDKQEATYNGVPIVTSGGVIVAPTLKNAQIS